MTVAQDFPRALPPYPTRQVWPNPAYEGRVCRFFQANKDFGPRCADADGMIPQDILVSFLPNCRSGRVLFCVACYNRLLERTAAEGEDPSGFGVRPGQGWLLLRQSTGEILRRFPRQ